MNLKNISFKIQKNSHILYFYFRFEIAIFILIFLNMVTMGIEHYNQSRAFTFTLEISNALFTTIFSLGNLIFSNNS